MAIKHIINKNHPNEILMRKFKGEVVVDDIINSWEELIKNNNLENVKGVINILDDCKLQLNMQRFEMLMKYLNSKPIFNAVKLAVVVNCPKNLVFPMLAEKKEPKLKIKPFSTAEAAEKWIIS